ncbi:MAG TPA: hypothetical protein VNU21_02120 [Usitatibacter sp.]|nr:hypothetical protein [Usitatibacter sp.]
MACTPAEQYRAVFVSMGTVLTSAAAAVGTVAKASVSGKFAVLNVLRDEADGAHGYTILLIEDGDGICRIESM